MFGSIPILLLAAALAAAPPKIEPRLHVKVPMRDGVRLCANVFRPQGSARLPAILVRTPYGKGTELVANYRAFAEAGYAVVLQDVRGRYDSQGTFEPFRQETNDGSDTLDWIARQPWSDGKIGMMGGSYLGIVQWRAALGNHPNLKAIFPVVSGSDDYFDRYYSTGGAMKLGQRLQWMSDNLRAPNWQPPEFHQFILTLPLRVADRAATGQSSDMYQRVIEHPGYDEFWASLSTLRQAEKIRVPVHAVGGWYDNFIQGDFEIFAALRKLNRPSRLLAGPWPHNMSMKFEGADYGPDSMAPVRTLQLAWFDYWLKGDVSKKPAAPPLRIFVMGANQWRDETEWPLARTRWTRLYLSSGGRANSLQGDGTLTAKPGRNEPPDRFVYDPRHPVPTLGGAVCCNPKVFPWGPRDQRAVESRADVLVYTGAVLKQDVEVTGPVKLVLYASTSAQDTDFTAKLVDVFPDGQARNLCDGILRVRYRNSLEKPQLAAPGETYALSIDAGVTSNVFRAGHRIRLEISSSNFPRFDRNPNTGRPVAHEAELRTAAQTVRHGREYASHLLLPVIPKAAGGPR